MDQRNNLRKATAIAFSVLLALSLALATAAQADGEKSKKEARKGYGVIEAIDHGAGVVQLIGERYSVTRKTELLNEYGLSARLTDFEAATSIGPFLDASSGTSVYFEVDKKGALTKLRIVKDLPG